MYTCIYTYVFVCLFMVTFGLSLFSPHVADVAHTEAFILFTWLKYDCKHVVPAGVSDTLVSLV